MVYVVLRNGKVLRYNRCEVMKTNEGILSLEVRRGGVDYVIAKFPVEIVERAESEPPCAIYKEAAPKRRGHR